MTYKLCHKLWSIILIFVAICNTVVISAEQQEKIVRVAPKRKTKTPVFEKAFLTPLREFGQSISGSIARKSKLRDGSTSGIENESYASTESISQASKSSRTETKNRKNGAMNESIGSITSPVNKFTGTLDPTPKKQTSGPVKRPLTLQLSQPEEETPEDDSIDTNRTSDEPIQLPISNLSGSKRSFETQPRLKRKKIDFNRNSVFRTIF